MRDRADEVCEKSQKYGSKDIYVESLKLNGAAIEFLLHTPQMV